MSHKIWAAKPEYQCFGGRVAIGRIPDRLFAKVTNPLNSISWACPDPYKFSLGFS